MSSLRLIGFSGPKGSGKDEAARALQARGGWMIINPGDPIRRMVFTLLAGAGYGLTEVDLFATDPIWREKPLERLAGAPTARRLMQTLGDDWGRNLIHPDLWAGLLERRIAEGVEGGWNVAVTGIRKPNEVALIHELGGEVWRIHRPGHEESGEHTSEQGFDALPCDRTIFNHGSVEDLHRIVLAALNEGRKGGGAP